jgi:hypothetical protein
MHRYAKANLIKPGKGQATSPLFQKRLQSALLATPEDPRAGHGPSDKRPMPRAKVAAAWLSCLRLSGAEIARTAEALVGSPVIYGSFRNWRTEAEFEALESEAAIQLVDDFVAAYKKCWRDRHACYALIEEALIYNEIIIGLIAEEIFRLAKKAKATGGMSDSTIHELSASKLAADYQWKWGMVSRAELRQALMKAGLTVTRSVESLRGIYAAAEKLGDWKLAKEAFDEMDKIAAGFARQADEKTESRTKMEALKKSRR